MSRVRPGAASREGALPYYLRKVRRHVEWARTEGVARLVEEDRLDPRARARTAVRKAAWRRANHRGPGTARAVYVVGLQRSGTNMLLRGIDEAPEVEVRNENDRRVFDRFRLRGDEVLGETVRASRHAVVLVKPLCETHRVGELLDLTGAASRAVWVHRDPVDRARSEVSKFGSSNLQALRLVAAGEGARTWQGGGLSEDSLAVLRSFDLDAMTPHTAAVLFWVLRNRLFFELGLDRRADVMALCYDRFVGDPEGQMQRLCAFIGLDYRPAFCAHVERRESHGRATLDIDPAVMALARGLASRLAEVS